MTDAPKMLSRKSSVAINRCPPTTCLFSSDTSFCVRIKACSSNIIFANNISAKELLRASTSEAKACSNCHLDFFFLGGWFNFGSHLWVSLLACAR